MTYPIDGTSHKNGVNSEKEAVKIFNENPEHYINKSLEGKYGSKVVKWVHMGGTKQVNDALVILEDGRVLGVSFKNHKRKIQRLTI